MADPILVSPSRNLAKKLTGGHDPTRSIYGFLEYMGSGITKYVNHFNGPTTVALPTDEILTFNGGGVSAASFVYQAGLGGWARGVTGTAGGATAVSMMGQSLNWAGNNNCAMEIRIKSSAVTGYKFEAGFIDTVPVNGTTVPPDTGAVNVLATPTWNLTGDGVVWAYDTTDTTTPRGLGIKAGTTTTAANRAAGVYTPTLAVFETFGVYLLGTDAYFWHADTNNNPDMTPVKVANAVTGTVPMTWWVFCKGLNGTSKNVDVDYVAVIQRLTTAG